MVKRGQAAMEFLMTYGWAILVVLVAVGALAYFGVLSPDNFLPSKCTLPSGIGCIDHKVTANQIQVVLRNGLGYDMSAMEVAAEGCGANVTSPATLNNGEDDTWTIDCGSPLTGSRYNGVLNVTYTLSDTGLTHTALGNIVSKVAS